MVDINASESVFNQYSRFNYNVTQLFDRNSIYGSSDHNPEVIGINRPNNGVEIQILGTNDFHGRIANDRDLGSSRCRGDGRCGQAAPSRQRQHGVRGRG